MMIERGVLLLCDAGFVVYLANIIISLYGFCLFAWWWMRCVKERGAIHVGPVYGYVTFLFLGISIEKSLNLLGRYYFVTDQIYLRDILLHNLLWKLRSVPLLVTVLLIVTHMSGRAFFKK